MKVMEGKHSRKRCEGGETMKVDTEEHDAPSPLISSHNDSFSWSGSVIEHGALEQGTLGLLKNKFFHSPLVASSQADRLKNPFLILFFQSNKTGHQITQHH